MQFPVHKIFNKGSVEGKIWQTTTTTMLIRLGLGPPTTESRETALICG